MKFKIGTLVMLKRSSTCRVSNGAEAAAPVDGAFGEIVFCALVPNSVSAVVFPKYPCPGHPYWYIHDYLLVKISGPDMSDVTETEKVKELENV